MFGTADIPRGSLPFPAPLGPWINSQFNREIAFYPAFEHSSSLHCLSPARVFFSPGRTLERRCLQQLRQGSGCKRAFGTEVQKISEFIFEASYSSFLGLSQTFYGMLSKIASIHLVSSDPEVYDPCDDSFALVDALLADRANLLVHRPSICMEIGCGSGYVITSLALLLGKEEFYSYYIATDINPRAVRVTRETLDAHGCRAELLNTDIASGLEERLAGSVDVMVVNPPYVPTPEEEVGCDGIASAWAGGEDGRRVIDRILPVADVLLSKKGWLYLVTLTANNPLEICLEMRKKGYASRIILQRSTEEESLHIIKFWRDLDTLLEANEYVAADKTENGLDAESLSFPHFSTWKSENCNIN